MKTFTLPLVAAGALAIGALAFMPKPAQALNVPLGGPVSYSATLHFHGNIINDTCQLDIGAAGLGTIPGLPISGLAGQTVTLGLGTITTDRFSENSGHDTQRNVFSLTVHDCPTAVSKIDFGFVQKQSTFDGNGVLGNYASTNAATNVGVKLTKNAGGSWSPIDLQNGTVTLNNVSTTAGSTFKLGYQLHTTDPQSIDTGDVKTNFGLTISYK